MPLLRRNLEHRILNKEELEQLINESEPSETKFLRDTNKDIFEFFKSYSIVQDGILVNGRPIYIAALIKSTSGNINFWTVVNKNTGAIIQMSRIVRQELRKWVNQYGILYAMMEKVNSKNMKWVEWLGFKPIHEDDRYITYRIGV